MKQSARRRGWPFTLFSVTLGLILSSALSSCRFGPSIPVLSLDQNNREIRSFIPEKRFAKSYGEVINETKTLTVEKLERFESRSHWQLKRITLGMGVTAEVGIGPLEMAVAPSMEIRLEKM